MDDKKQQEEAKYQAIKALYDDSISTETCIGLAWDAGYEDFNDFLKAVGA